MVDMGMTDKQFDRIIKMVSMILDGCKDLEEAKEKMEEAEKLVDKAADNELAKKEAAKVKKILDDEK